MRNIKNLKILIEREENGGDLAVHFYYSGQDKMFKIKKTDEILNILNKFFSVKKPLSNTKIKLKFKGDVGMLNKRIAETIIKTTDFYNS